MLAPGSGLQDQPSRLNEETGPGSGAGLTSLGSCPAVSGALPSSPIMTGSVSRDSNAASQPERGPRNPLGVGSGLL